MSLLETHGYPFLAVYLGVGVAIFCVMLASRRSLCGPWHGPANPSLKDFDLGYLAGGKERMEEVAKAKGVAVPTEAAVEARMKSLGLLVPTWKGGISFLLNIGLAGLWFGFGVYRVYVGFRHHDGMLATMLLVPLVFLAFFLFIELLTRDSLLSGYGGEFIEEQLALHAGWRTKAKPIAEEEKATAVALFGPSVL